MADRSAGRSALTAQDSVGAAVAASKVAQRVTVDPAPGRRPKAQPLQQAAPGQVPAPVTPARRDEVTGVEKGGGRERQDWVRQLLEGLWPYAREAAERLACQVIPEQLEASRPPFVYELRLERFSLGDARPEIRDIRVHRGPGGGGLEEMFLEFEAEWRSQQDVELHILVPRLPVAVAEVTPDCLEDAMRLVMRLRVRLKQAWIRAGVRLALRPLLRRLPVVGALQAGLTRVPEFGYDLQLSVASAALVPLIRQWLDGAVRDLPWVLPEHYFLPIDPGVRDVERPAGVLAVRVLGAENVPKPGLLASARPMLELFVRDSQRRQTCVAPVGSSPTWGKPRFEFPVSVPEHQELCLVLYHYRDWVPNEEVGRAVVPLRSLPPGRPREVELVVRSPAEQQHDDEQQRLGGLGRAALALGRPFTKRGSQLCKLRLQLVGGGRVEGQRRLEGGAGAVVQLEAQYKPYF
ncbi:hypothetical protein CHLNCDRAFT_141362 [Chlorella variabilis]|uniref:C2 domain-containing protein n=1 Tax=Chlorella variabilis TaxID=554065 RepID=E1ZSQ6_CHLVA|nr:hypothetical protein CHLNCDRAFT_141362 [Chlorella variabilis]EFN51193.1 hypothetical protein CHLNCDRAFT_141362 [Chlorella variabilis]|eukprot:XP_005843295.1 hypothetical protein CHLNCDRAFT_141362 [Chlorella variabilis]